MSPSQNLKLAAEVVSIPDGKWPSGVRATYLSMHEDERGAFTEIFRDEWQTCPPPVQWNAVSSQAGVLRGVHVHVKHWDYLIVLNGHMTLGLKDLRRESPTYGLACRVELSGEKIAAINIPPGVAHGFYFPVPSLHVYAVSAYWDPHDELGCLWSDPELGIPWTLSAPRLSERDASLSSLSELEREFESQRKTQQEK